MHKMNASVWLKSWNTTFVFLQLDSQSSVCVWLGLADTSGLLVDRGYYQAHVIETLFKKSQATFPDKIFRSQPLIQ